MGEKGNILESLQGIGTTVLEHGPEYWQAMQQAQEARRRMAELEAAQAAQAEKEAQAAAEAGAAEAARTQAGPEAGTGGEQAGNRS